MIFIGRREGAGGGRRPVAAINGASPWWWGQRNDGCFRRVGAER
jgi:hypothetical protein